MAEKSYRVLPEKNISITASAADKLIASGDGLAALLYIYLLKNGSAELPKMSADLKKSENEIERAFSTLISLGLAAGDTSESVPERADELPEYTIDDVNNELKSGAEFRDLVNGIESCLGRLLSSDDLRKLFGIYDHLGLPPEVILFLVNFCDAEYKERYGTSRRTTMRYIEKVAFAWEREGICTLDLAEARVNFLLDRKSAAGRIKSVLGIRDRNLTSSEQKYVNAWADMGFPPETIEIAYDRTVLRTGKLSWKYMDTILKSWKSKGIVTPEQAANENGARAVSGAQTGQNIRPEDNYDDIDYIRGLIDKMRSMKEDE